MRRSSAPFDEKECTELASQQRSKDLAKNSASGSELQTIFYEKRKEKAKRENKNEISVPKSISNGSLRKYQKIILPEKLKTAKKQNKRRLQAVSDLPNFVSAAGVFMSVFSVDLNDARYSRVRPELELNLDGMSVKVGPPYSDQQTAYLTKDVKKELQRDHARSAGVTGEQSMKYRCVKHHFVTSANGQLHEIFLLIKDKHVKVLDVHRCLEKINGADVHLILYPASKTQQQQQLILDEIKAVEHSRMNDDNDNDDDNDENDGDDSSCMEEVSVNEEEDEDDNDENDDLDEDEGEEVGLTNFEVLIMKAVLCDILVPKVLELQDAYMEKENALVVGSSSDGGSTTHNNKRSRSSSSQVAASSSSSSSSKKHAVISSTERPAAALLVDGDYAQIERIMRSFANKRGFDKHNIDIVKLSAGCSMALQPNDLMSGHRDIRSMVAVKDYTTKVTKEDLPFFSHLARQVEQILFGHGMEKASRDIFVNYCEDFFRLVSASFTVVKIKAGWEVSGLYPFDPHQILRQCATFKGFSYEDGKGIEAKLPELRERAYYTAGHLTDEDIFDIFGDLLSSEITNMSSRPLIQQRTMVLNSPAAIAIRRNKLEDKQAKETEALQKKASADSQKKLELAVKSAIEENKVPFYSGAPFDDLPTFCYGNCKAVRGDYFVGGDDGWRACPCCHKIWSCMKRAKCRNDMISHVAMCSAACHNRGKYQLSADIVNAAA